MLTKQDVQKLIEEYPDTYQQALTHLKQFEVRVESLREQDEEKEPRVSKDVRKKQRLILAIETDIINTDAEIERITVDLNHAKALVHVDYLSANPKSTVANAIAHVDAEEDIAKLEYQLAKARTAKQLLRQDIKVCEQDIRELEDVQTPLYRPNPKLEKAEEELAEARAIIKTLKIRLEAYKLLLTALV